MNSYQAKPLDASLKAAKMYDTNMYNTGRKNWLLHYYFRRGNIDECKLIISEELKLNKEKEEYSFYVKGNILRQEGKIQESLECFQSCYSLFPRSFDVMKQIGRSLYLLGRQRLAVDAFNEATSLVQTPEWDVFHNLGLCMLTMGEYEKAKGYLRQSIQLNRQENTYIPLARVHVAEGDIPSAIEVYQQCLEMNPENVEANVSLALLYMDIGDHQKAFEKFGSALALMPSCTRALLAVGALMQGHGEIEVALAKYKVAADYISQSASLWNNLGMCFFGKKRLVSAVSCLKRAHSLAPFDWKILLNLGLVHLATQQYASAFHFLSSAINLEPTAGPVFLPLAVTLVHLNDRQNARYAFEEAVALTNTAAAMANYALFLIEEGDKKGAAAMYRRFKTAALTSAATEPEVVELGKKLRTVLDIHDTPTEVGGLQQQMAQIDNVVGAPQIDS